MPKTSGLADNFYVGGSDLSGDVNSLGKISGSMSPLDATTINQSANSRIPGLRDGGIDFVTFMDPAAGAAHLELSPLPTTDQICTYFRGQALGNPAASLNSKQTNYDMTRGADGSLTFAVSSVGNAFGLEWGTQLTAGLRTDTVNTNGAAVNSNAAATAFGAQGYLQVTAVTGSNVGVRIESSTSGTASWTTLIDFGIQSAAGGVRATTALPTTTVNQFTRAVTYGTALTSITFATQLSQNPASVVF